MQEEPTFGHLLHGLVFGGGVGGPGCLPVHAVAVATSVDKVAGDVGEVGDVAAVLHGRECGVKGAGEVLKFGVLTIFGK